MATITFQRFDDDANLPTAQHHFSTLVFHNNTYFELKGNYHKAYPSHQLYKAWWGNVTRRGFGAKKAIEIRVRSVLVRSGVHVVSFKYMTTITKPGSNHMRHVAAVTLSDHDFGNLNHHGYLRQLHTFGEERSREEVIRCVLYELNPLSLLPKPDMAA